MEGHVCRPCEVVPAWHVGNLGVCVVASRMVGVGEEAVCLVIFLQDRSNN